MYYVYDKLKEEGKNSAKREMDNFIEETFKCLL